MVRTDAGHKPEHMVIGATLTTLSFLCVSVMSALGKVAGQLTSTGVVVLFQNLICLLFIAPIALHGGCASLRPEKIGLHILRAASGTACWYALFVAVALMSVRWLGATEPMPRILFYYFLLSTVMAIPIAAIQWHSVPARAWIYLLSIGFAQLFAQVLIVLAYRYASSVKLGPFIYTTIVFTALIDWVVWDHPPTLFVVLGMVLVIGGGLVAIRGKTEAPLAAIES